jgi:protein-L-isoaspartate(D-aspartate) O-methyltransferase
VSAYRDDAASGIDLAVEARDVMVDRLRGSGMITTEVVERAFRTVPRHVFAPEGTPLSVAYDPDVAVPVKRNAAGAVMSSISAPFIQARMIEQAGLRADQSVLEVGSGGYNAALVAEIVGPGGRVVSVDIDPEVVNRARVVLDAAGYGRRVTLVQADGAHPLPGLDGSVDAILVTAGAWDLAPAWLDHLAGDGVLVVPLRMRGVTRSLAFRREGEGDHLVSTSAEVCGFVPMQGAGAHDDRVVVLTDRQGHQVRLRFDRDMPPDPGLLDHVLATDRTEVWSGITIGPGESFADLQLWFAGFLPGVCTVSADEGTEIAADRKSWFPFGTVRGDSFAYLALRPAADGDEFGARAYGTHSSAPATAMVEQIRAWDRHARTTEFGAQPGMEPVFGYWPTGATPTSFDQDTTVLTKTHGVVTISWPATTQHRTYRRTATTAATATRGSDPRQ